MMSTIHNRQYQQYYMVMPAQQDCSDFAKGTLGYGGCNRVFVSLLLLLLLLLQVVLLTL